MAQAIGYIELHKTREGINEYPRPAGLDSVEATVELPYDPHVDTTHTKSCNLLS